MAYEIVVENSVFVGSRHNMMSQASRGGRHGGSAWCCRSNQVPVLPSVPLVRVCTSRSLCRLSRACAPLLFPSFSPAAPSPSLNGHHLTAGHAAQDTVSPSHRRIKHGPYNTENLVKSIRKTGKYWKDLHPQMHRIHGTPTAR